MNGDCTLTSVPRLHVVHTAILKIARTLAMFWLCLFVVPRYQLSSVNGSSWQCISLKLKETLAIAMQKMMYVLGSFTSDTEVKVGINYLL